MFIFLLLLSLCFLYALTLLSTVITGLTNQLSPLCSVLYLLFPLINCITTFQSTFTQGYAPLTPSQPPWLLRQLLTGVTHYWLCSKCHLCNFKVGNLKLINSFDIPHFCVLLPHQCNPIVSLQTKSITKRCVLNTEEVIPCGSTFHPKAPPVYSNNTVLLTTSSCVRGSSTATVPSLWRGWYDDPSFDE